MKIANQEAFHFIGISVRTTNENQQAMQDIPQLWNKFMSENWQEKIPNRIDQSVICMYTDYEGDHNKPYTTLLGCRVNSLEEVPADMRGLTVKGGPYVPFQAQGNLNEGAVIQTWLKIWESGMDRSYTVDYEVYGAKALDPTDAEVAIFIAVP